MKLGLSEFVLPSKEIEAVLRFINLRRRVAKRETGKNLETG